MRFPTFTGGTRLLLAGLLVGGGGCAVAGDETHDAGAEAPSDASCGSTMALCAAECVSLNDPRSCGGCGVACRQGEQCCDQRCIETATCAFAVTGVEPAHGWQNGGNFVTLHGAGFGAGLRVHIGDGRAPVQVTSGSTAKIVTPPGTQGLRDVEIQLGGARARLHAAFTYDSAGITKTWSVATMSTSRGARPALAVLRDGRALVAGGATGSTYDTAVSSAELFDPVAASVASVSSVMATQRYYATAVTLLDGRVLVAGGACDGSGSCIGSPALLDVFDPATGAFASVGGAAAIVQPSAVLLPDGTVLVASAGGRLDVFDPTTNVVTALPQTLPGAPSFMVRLRDGRVLFGAFGFSTAVQIYDQDSASLTSVGSLVESRGGARAHTLPDGRVLVIAGERFDGVGGVGTLDTLELFDPKTATFAAAPYKLTVGRYYHATALIRDGSVLVFGGHSQENQPMACAPMLSAVDRIDPKLGTVTAFSPMPNANAGLSAITLLDGTVVAAGGGACSPGWALPDILYLRAEQPH